MIPSNRDSINVIYGGDNHNSLINNKILSEPLQGIQLYKGMHKQKKKRIKPVVVVL